MKVWHYCYGGSYFWVAEGAFGYRTKGFRGGAPDDPQAAITALEAAQDMDEAIAARPDAQERRAVLEGMKDRRYKVLRPRRGEFTRGAVVVQPRGRLLRLRRGYGWT